MLQDGEDPSSAKAHGGILAGLDRGEQHERGPPLRSALGEQQRQPAQRPCGGGFPDERAMLVQAKRTVDEVVKRGASVAEEEEEAPDRAKAAADAADEESKA